MDARKARTRSRFLAVVSAISCVLLSRSQAEAQTTHYVDNLGDCAASTPCHATITEAVAAAAPADIIEVFTGVYREAVVFGPGKDNIVLRARTSALMPVISAPAGSELPASAITLFARGVQVRHFALEAPEGSGVTAALTEGAAGALIHGNWITGGVSLRSCSASAVTGNWIISGGINAPISANGCVFDGNTVDGASIVVGSGDFPHADNVVRRNIVRGGDIAFGTGRLRRNVVQSNRVEGGGIRVIGVFDVDGNIIRQNTTRGGGGIQLRCNNNDLGSNTIESNFVSGSSGDGIAVGRPGLSFGGTSLIRRNTSVDNAGCDINDHAGKDAPQNTWRNNRFGTKCGAATE